MDIFNGNRKLDEATMYGIDWAVFLRDQHGEQLIPFMFLFDNEKIRTQLLMTEDNPFEYAARILAIEKADYQQFVIGTEGYLRNENNEKVEAIIVQGFDKTQEKGVALGQMFDPTGKKGKFQKIGRISFLGPAKLPIPLVQVDQPNYSTVPLGFTGMTMKNGDYFASFTHQNPSVVANGISNYIESKLTEHKMSGRFTLKISPGLIDNEQWIKFLALSAIETQRTSPTAAAWEQKTRQKLMFNCDHGDISYLKEFEMENVKSTDEPPAAGQPKGGKYANFTEAQLNNEFNRITNIPNARTNISALDDMVALMDEYEKRGIPLPGQKAKKQPSASKQISPKLSANPKAGKKPWWKFW